MKRVTRWVAIEGQQHLVDVQWRSETRVLAAINGKHYDLNVWVVSGECIVIERNGKRCRFYFAGGGGALRLYFDGVHRVATVARSKVGTPMKRIGVTSDQILAPMPGVVTRIFVREGQEIAPGERLIELEAMKMINAIASESSCIINKVHVAEGDSVAPQQLLFTTATVR